MYVFFYFTLLQNNCTIMNKLSGKALLLSSEVVVC